jgi:hypothetical protein
MFVYVDESGDAGFKIGKGSSEHFVVATVIVDHPIELTAALESLRANLGLPANFEFKFLSSNARRREIFFEELRRHEVSIRGFVVHKQMLLEARDYRSNDYFYRTLLARALIDGRSDLVQASISLDRFMSSRSRMRELTSHLRRTLQEEVVSDDGLVVQRIKDVAHRDSKTDPMIQVADMVAGAIGADRRGTDSRSLALIKSRVREITDWYGED